MAGERMLIVDDNSTSERCYWPTHTHGLVARMSLASRSGVAQRCAGGSRDARGASARGAGRKLVRRGLRLLSAGPAVSLPREHGDHGRLRLADALRRSADVAAG